MLACRAAIIAARSRGFDAGSGRPWRADTVISRISLANCRPRRASCAPFRCMMFLNWECPAMVGCQWSVIDCQRLQERWWPRQVAPTAGNGYYTSMNLDNGSASQSPPAADRLLGVIKRRGAQRIADLALALGITAEAARQQLARLATEGLVTPVTERRGVGR